MSEQCNHDCGSCGEAGCGERNPESLLEKPHAKSQIKKVIGIVSGKGGVGKSSVASLAAVASAREGYQTAIMDADVTGPSIPKMFGVEGQVYGADDGIIPAVTKTGIKMVSTNLILENPEDPVIWRGPVVAGLIKQFWTDVIWGSIDYMFIDMPPGTGDVPLTVFQSIPVDGISVVTSPQDLVSMIVAKAVKMASMMEIPVLGVVENMSYVKCPHCGEEIKVYGESHLEEIAAQQDLDIIARLPMDPALAQCCDKGQIELYTGEYIDALASVLSKAPVDKA